MRSPRTIKISQQRFSIKDQILTLIMLTFFITLHPLHSRNANIHFVIFSGFKLHLFLNMADTKQLECIFQNSYLDLEILFVFCLTNLFLCSLESSLIY